MYAFIGACVRVFLYVYACVGLCMQLLTVPTEREKMWIPDELRLKRAEYVELAKGVNAAFLEVLVYM